MHWLRAGGPQRDFELFVTDSTGQLLRSAYLMTSDLAGAEDLVQETLLRVARRWLKVRAMEHPAAYARRILVNLVIDGAGQRAGTPVSSPLRLARACPTGPTFAPNVTCGT